MSVLVGLGILGYIGKEDGVEVLFSNAITCVANKKLNLFVVVKEAITKLYTTFFSMFDRIAYQIAQHLCQSVGVGVEDNLLVGLVTSHLHHLVALKLEAQPHIPAKLSKVGIGLLY